MKIGIKTISASCSKKANQYKELKLIAQSLCDLKAVIVIDAAATSGT
jgi:hypothetical protein